MKKGLALAGGGSLGAYEVGALKYILQERKMKFDIVTGTSVGSINAAMVVSGAFDNLEALWRELDMTMVINNGVDMNQDSFKQMTPTKFNALANSAVALDKDKIAPFKALCAKYINEYKVSESDILCGLVCCEMPALKETRVLLTGLDPNYVRPFIHASSACFPVFPMEKIDGRTYIDGTYKNILPLDYCFELGADEVVVIDLDMFKGSQHSYLFKMPNVTYIKPRFYLGSFMNFKREDLDKNMRRGYNDAKKVFGEYLGFKYTFNYSESLKRFADKFIKYISVPKSNEERFIIKKIINAVDANLYEHELENNNINFVLEILEMGTNENDFDDSLVYDFDEFFTRVGEEAVKTRDEYKGIGRNGFERFFDKMVLAIGDGFKELSELPVSKVAIKYMYEFYREELEKEVYMINE